MEDHRLVPPRVDDRDRHEICKNPAYCAQIGGEGYLRGHTGRQYCIAEELREKVERETGRRHLFRGSSSEGFGHTLPVGGDYLGPGPLRGLRISLRCCQPRR